MIVLEYGTPQSLKELQAVVWLSVPLGLIATAPITYAVFQSLRGQRVSFGKCLAVLIRRRRKTAA